MKATKKIYMVEQVDYSRGKREVYRVMATTPIGASNIVSRDHFNNFSYNKVYLNGEMVYRSKKIL